MKNRSGEKIKLASIDELLGVVNEESAMEIEISKIHPFKNHPFKVLDDEKMQDLVESVRINGVLTPVLLRMERRFMHYLETCAKYDMKIGNQAAYAAIGIDKGIAWEWVNRCTTNPARTDFIKKVQKVCALYREGLMQDGKVNPVTGIFWQKNYDGMKDQTEMVLTPNNPLGDSADTEALARKYLDNADIVDVPEGEISEVAEGAESHKIK